MQGFMGYPLKSAFTWGNRPGFRAVAVVMPVPPVGCGAVIFIVWSWDNPVKYTDPNGKFFGIDDFFTGPVDEIIVVAALMVAAALGNKWAQNRLDQIEDFIENILLSEGEDITSIPLVPPRESAKQRRAREKTESNEGKHGDTTWEEPASEDYTKWRAKQVEKEYGKDRRREGHDEKEHSEPDRSKTQVDEDYGKGGN
jgi:hypothetical protein